MLNKLERTSRNGKNGFRNLCVYSACHCYFFDIESWLEKSDSERLTNDKLHTESSHNELSAYTIICLEKEPLLNEIITNEN